MQEPSEPRTEGRDEETGRSSERGEDQRPTKYGGPRDPNWERTRGRTAERERTQREYEQRLDRQRSQQRDFQRDKSGGRYRRR